MPYNSEQLIKKEIKPLEQKSTKKVSNSQNRQIYYIRMK